MLIKYDLKLSQLIFRYRRYGAATTFENFVVVSETLCTAIGEIIPQ
jgi:hypothetical protein